MPTVQEKKEFLQWFLNNKKMKRREVSWLLHYMMNHEKPLENIHFVDDISGCEVAIVASADCSNEMPFRFHNKGEMIIDPDRAMYFLRLNRQQDVYFQLNFKDAFSCKAYSKILEANPHIETDQTQLSDDEMEMVEQVLEKSIREFQYHLISKQIDEALDKNDRNSFLKLTEQLNQLSKVLANAH